jgi:hypothetical protein
VCSVDQALEIEALELRIAVLQDVLYKTARNNPCDNWGRKSQLPGYRAERSAPRSIEKHIQKERGGTPNGERVRDEHQDQR